MKTEKILLGGWKKVFPDEIIFLKAAENYTHVFLDNGKQILVATHLKIIENRLQNYRFFRTHKSSLVNLNFVKNYDNQTEKGIIILANDQLIEVSRRKNRILRNILTI